MHVFSPANTDWQLGLFRTASDYVVTISAVKAFSFSSGVFFFVSMIIACFLVYTRRYISTPNISADDMTQHNLFSSALDIMWL